VSAAKRAASARFSRPWAWSPKPGSGLVRNASELANSDLIFVSFAFGNFEELPFKGHRADVADGMKSASAVESLNAIEAAGASVVTSVAGIP
jgi:hypothetical protein